MQDFSDFNGNHKQFMHIPAVRTLAVFYFLNLFFTFLF